MRVPSPTKRLVSGIALAGVAAAAGCGASYTSIYEGDVRFEHCYRLDEEPAVPTAKKHACWHAWAKFYTYGQTRDRVEYAMAREQALAEATMTACDPARRSRREVAAPTPTNAFAPPPQTMPREDAGAPTAAAAPASPPEAPALASAPGSQCATSCGGTWKHCASACETGVCNVKCDDTYRRCMRGCY